MPTQKYIGDKFIYEIDEFFVEKLSVLPKDLAFDIAMQVEENAMELPRTDIFGVKYGGVSNITGQAIFFEIEFVYEDDDVLYLSDLDLIDSDSFLDYYIEKKTFKIKYNE